MGENTNNLFHQLDAISHSGITSFGGKSYSDNVDVFLIFHLEVRASPLNARTYSEYQQFLHRRVTALLQKGWTFNKITRWFNDNGYPIILGRIFKSSHVHSIVKKKKASDERVNRRCKPKLTQFRLRFMDRTLVNQI